jgi:alkylation response protein AidB-like acyl-CoA dehydrogenase
MRLEYTERQDEFRAEVRDWLAANLPRESLQSFDTEAGFEQHRAWERKLSERGFSAVTWPAALGGRGCNLIEWLIFEEEYWAAGAPLRVNQNGVFLLAPTLLLARLDVGVSELLDFRYPAFQRAELGGRP